MEGYTRNRLEQRLAKNIIKKRLLPGWRIENEYPVTDIQVVDYYDRTGDRMPTIDIAIFSPTGKKYGIEVNGRSHDRRQNADKLRDKILSHPKNGWKMTKFSHREMPHLFKIENSDETVSEIRKYLKNFIPLLQESQVPKDHGIAVQN